MRASFSMASGEMSILLTAGEGGGRTLHDGAGGGAGVGDGEPDAFDDALAAGVERCPLADGQLAERRAFEGVLAVEEGEAEDGEDGRALVGVLGVSVHVGGDKRDSGGPGR